MLHVLLIISIFFFTLLRLSNFYATKSFIDNFYYAGISLSVYETQFIVVFRGPKYTSIEHTYLITYKIEFISSQNPTELDSYTSDTSFCIIFRIFSCDYIYFWVV